MPKTPIIANGEWPAGIPQRKRQISSPAPGYRPDIDGLRAVAVLLVVLFHLEVEGFSGGFVGVDVFFVISGFLITRIIVDDVRAGGFSASRFYARRARRLLPALFATLVFAGVGAFLLLPPDQLQRAGGSMLFSVLNLANVFFWSGAEYFDADAATKPLLHLWSLGVEEQFYAVWPLLLVLLLRRSARVAVGGLVAAGSASLWLNGWFLEGAAVPVLTAAFPSLAGWMVEAEATAFYLMPFRIFEFAIGALMVWLVPTHRRRVVLLELMLLAGLAMIAASNLLFSVQTTFPYLNALVPSVGAALVILAGTAPVSGRLLRHPAVVGVGRTSYSLYLLHWPLIVLYRAYTSAPPTPVAKGVLLCAAIVGAALMYWLVEQPFRRGGPARWTVRTTLGIAVAASMTLAVPAAMAWAQGGWTWRLPAERLARSDAEWRAIERASCRHWDPSMPRELVTCQNARGAATTILVWGDSHALHLITGLSDAFRAQNVHVLYMADCAPQSGFEGYVYAHLTPRARERCVERNHAALEFILQQPPSTVVLSGAKRDRPEDLVGPSVYLLSRLRAAGHTAFVLGDFIRPGDSVISCRSVPDWLVPDSTLLRRCAPIEEVVDGEMRYAATLLTLLPEVVDVRAVQCPGGTCQFVDSDGTPLFRDAHHLTPEGSIRLIARLRRALPIAPADPPR